MLDEYVPPVKRLKLHTTEHFWLKDKNNNKENIDPQCPELCQNRIVRKRKIPMRRRNQPSLLTLSTSVLLEIVDYLSLTDLCNVAEASNRMFGIAQRSFKRRFINGFQMDLNGISDFMLLNRVLRNFGSVITSISISTT